MIETYRMLGKQREDELLREARRLQAGEAAKSCGGRGRRRLATLYRLCSMLWARLRGAMPGQASTAE
jgi:hypothetical protein